jgi:hypothetical protein
LRLRFITLAYLGLAGEKGMASASRRRAITLPFSWSYSSIGFPVRRAVFEAYDGARDAAPRADSAAARAGQHVMAAAIVPAHQIGLDGPLTEHHVHRILDVSRRDIACASTFLKASISLFSWASVIPFEHDTEWGSRQGLWPKSFARA